MLDQERAKGVKDVVNSGVGMEGQLSLVEDSNRAVGSSSTKLKASFSNSFKPQQYFGHIPKSRGDSNGVVEEQTESTVSLLTIC